MKLRTTHHATQAVRIRKASPAEIASMAPWPRRTYDEGGAVIVSAMSSEGEADVAIPVRLPLTPARLAELDAGAWVVLTRHPARYPQRAYQMINASWQEVEVVGALEDARTGGLEHVAPTTHVRGLRRVAPHEFARLLEIGCGRIEDANSLELVEEEEEEADDVERALLKLERHADEAERQMHTYLDWEERRDHKDHEWRMRVALFRAVDSLTEAVWAVHSLLAREGSRHV